MKYEEQYRIRVKRDEWGDSIVRGRFGHLYEHVQPPFLQINGIGKGFEMPAHVERIIRRKCIQEIVSRCLKLDSVVVAANR